MQKEAKPPALPLFRLFLHSKMQITSHFAMQKEAKTPALWTAAQVASPRQTAI
jgi:hypothetical protein